ncbi:MAG: LytTR family DNA-binding domain-containing protein [Erysipelotrichaceae bacterium]|nr:LytTR family DNA-binding domain-containing protein [Erysipelotrichaceae bacterium]
MKIAVCDDNINDLKYIGIAVKKAFQANSIMCELNSYTSAKQLLADNANQPFDAIFLDLDMPEINGMEAAERINEIGTVTEIIFVTNHDELVYEAFKFRAIGFIRKKFLDKEINEIIKVLIDDINLKQHYLIFFDSGSEKKCCVNDVIYMQSDDHYVDIITNNKKITVRTSLNDIEKKYSQYGFIRIHSRYLVNYRYIFSIEKNAVILDNNCQLSLSRSKITSTKEAFQFFSRRI